MSDTNLGIHFAPHKTNCRCDDCHMERLQTQNMALKTKLTAAEAEIATLRDTLVLIDNRCYQDEWVVETIADAMGENG